MYKSYNSFGDIGTYGSIVRCLFSIDKIALEVALKLPSK